MVQRREDEYSPVDLVMLRKIQRKVLSKEKREYEIRSAIFWNTLFSHHNTRHERISGKAVKTTYPYPRTTASKRTYDRSVIVKVSYKTFRKGNVSAEMKQRIQTNTAECIEYFLRFEDSLAFNEKHTGLTKEELKEEFKDDAVFKIMVSPEDPEILTENYIRKIVSFIELHARHHLKWAAVFHDNTEHPHAHIMISRTSGDGLSWDEPLVLEKDFISHGLREECQRIATKKLGRRSIDEYRIPFYSSLETKGLARIDHIIAGATRDPGTGLFIPSSEDSFILSRARLAELPPWQQELVIKRLEFLSENTDAGFRKEGGYWKCYKPYTWKEVLMDTAKTEPFRQLEKVYGTKIEVVGSGEVKERIDGKVIGHTIVDDNSERVGLVVKTAENKLFYTETNMSLSSAESVDGKSAEITEKEAKDKRYRTAVVKISEENPRGMKR